MREKIDAILILVALIGLLIAAFIAAANERKKESFDPLETVVENQMTPTEFAAYTDEIRLVSAAFDTPSWYGRANYARATWLCESDITGISVISFEIKPGTDGAGTIGIQKRLRSKLATGDHLAAVRLDWSRRLTDGTTVFYSAVDADFDGVWDSVWDSRSGYPVEFLASGDGKSFSIKALPGSNHRTNRWEDRPHMGELELQK